MMEKENMFWSEGKSSTNIPYGISNNELNCSSSFFKLNPNWENNNNNNSMDQSDPFESALSSMVSSPTASNANGNGNGNGNGENNIVLRELIGRLGSMCNSGEISPQQISNANTTSCYSTPLNSPPKLNLSTMMENQQQQQQMRGRGRGDLQISPNHFPPSLPTFSTDPGFAERAARFSCFANKNLNDMPPNPKLTNSGIISSNQSIKISGSHSTSVQENWDGTLQENGEFDSRENSSVSEQIPIGMSAQNDANSRKRKSTPKGKGKEPPPASTPAKDATQQQQVASENSESSAKRSKSEDEKTNQKQSSNSKDNNSKPPEPPKDYIHVRARRGQATDAHSLAERVRREKISERMKVLQDLVPGCNKVTGKAVMLDEIINYVQSLQRQVEFLSMKLATVNPRMDFNMEALMSKDMFQSRGSLPHNVAYPADSYPFQSQPSLHNAIPCGTEAPFLPNNLNAAAIGRNQNQNMHLTPMDNFSETVASQVSSTFWDDDLHSIVQMGFSQNQTQSFQGILPTAQMKVEL